jgi:putative phage-type endonuclease
MADLGDRKTYVGGSDIAAIMGISRWKSRLEIWLEKTGLKLPEIVDSVAADLGTELEEYVATRFTKTTGKKVRRVNKAYKDSARPYMLGHIDRDVVGEDAILECKTCSAYMANAWKDDEIPVDYILQVYWYMFLTGAKKAYIAVLIGNQDFQVKEIDRTEKVEMNIIRMREAVIDFWDNYVIPGVMPMDFKASDKDALSELYPINKIPKLIELDIKITKKFETLQALQSDKGKVEYDIDVLKADIQVLIGENDGAVCGTWEATWKTQDRETIDTKTLKKEEPETYKKYAKKSTSRVFRFKNKLEKEVE